LVVGAGATHAEVAASAEVRKAIPALAALAEHIGDAQVRNRGTLGGSLAHNDPSADYPAAALALGAVIKTDRRTITADAFFKGMYQTALQPDEVITAVRFPIPEKAAYAKFPHPASRFALVGVMVAKGPAGLRVAVTGAGPAVYRAPELEKALTARFSADALAGVKLPAAGLNADSFASAEYRAHLVGVMAKRAVAACG
jgi:carbon-monoxide dehydrogenase medium subunit